MEALRPGSCFGYFQFIEPVCVVSFRVSCFVCTEIRFSYHKILLQAKLDNSFALDFYASRRGLPSLAMNNLWFNLFSGCLTF